ncbi:MAG: hypothetical protein IKO88_05905 [Bacteroidales bacterium]|nr:hypothetical protein [Bacteroidales bacterium]
MKNTYKYIALGIALLASSLALNAQTYHEEGGMKTSKTVTGPVNNYYTITLESFATGETTVTETATPVDIVLVLDVSGSMDEELNNFSYTARNRSSYSYDSYGNNTYYYKHTDDNYYPVSRTAEYDGSGSQYQWSNYYTRLSYSVDGTTYYLSGETTTTTPPTNVKGDSNTIWTGVLYNRVSTGSGITKMAALKNAVQTFVNTVHHNALYDSKDTPRGTPLTNQIAVVKYAMNQFVNSNGTVQNTSQNPANANSRDVLTPGNHFSGGYNATEVLVGFTDVSSTAGVNTVMGVGTAVGVNDLDGAGATASDFGMTKAWYLLNQNSIKNRESNKVVVLFTDGSPTYQSNFDTNVAGRTIAWAKDIKDDFDATVFTIGVFDEETDNIRNYMNWTSSNYPNATGWNAGGTGSDKGYYQNASNADLDEIFEAVAHAAGAADATAGASTQVRDVVSNSFILPSGDAAGITIKVADVSSDGLGWEDPEEVDLDYEITTVTTSTGEEHRQLMVTGFDYTKADTYDADGFTITPGNWVGERYTSGTDKYWAGKKLIIEFKVQANGEATGGDGTATNHPDSGIYVQEFEDDGVTPKLDEDGNPIYHRVNQYDVPHTPLPVLIKIQKDGLRTGESATFQLFRARPKGWNDEGTTLEEKMANVEYNAIGKPLPDLHDFDSQGGKLDQNDPMDYLEGIGWDDWSKVILTNKGADKASVLKTLYALDPGWVYMVVEDDWGWSYVLSGESTRETTSDSELNPFRFHNTARTVNLEGNPIVKHAEAVTINHFETLEGEGAREEHYKSSKTIFQTGTNNNN